MTTARDDTRTSLLEAAERLFAERGIDAVSLREINREAGARNNVALQYHFTDRDGLVAAILAKHEPGIEAARHALLDQYEAEARQDLRTLAAALVRPPAAKLTDPAGGLEFLQVWADLLNRPRPVVGGPPFDDPANSLHRWRAMVEPYLDADAIHLHRRFTALLYAAVELGRRSRSGPHPDNRLFVSHLVDVVTAILGGPVSDETRRLARQRHPASKSARGGTKRRTRDRD